MVKKLDSSNNYIMLILKYAHYLRSMQSGVRVFWNETLHIIDIG